MYVAVHHGIQWSLDDEDLEPVVSGLIRKGDVRREYSIHTFKDGKIFIKFFAERGVQGFIRNNLRPRGKREYDVSRLLREAGVKTPRVLGYASAPNGSYVVTEWVDGVPLSLAILEPERRPELLTGLARLLAALARTGFVHNDLHLENVIAGEDGLYLIDLHKTRRKSKLTRTDELSNLSHALAMIWGGMDEGERAAFFAEYGAPLRPETEAALARLHKRWVERKAQRAFKATSRLQASKERVVVRGTEGKGKGEFLALIKKDRKVMVQRFSDHIRKVYVGSRRLQRAWENHVVLEYLKLPVVPRPFFVQIASVTRSGFIAMEDVAGRGEELDRFLDRHYDTLDGRTRRTLIDSFAAFLASLLIKGITHADLKACNVFALADGGFLFLDIEDVGFLGVNEKRLVTMLTQLNTTVPKRISRRDRLRFYARLVSGLNLDKKQLLKGVVAGSAGREIVYEGVDGLKIEAWDGRP